MTLFSNAGPTVVLPCTTFGRPTTTYTLKKMLGCFNPCLGRNEETPNLIVGYNFITFLNPTEWLVIVLVLC